MTSISIHRALTLVGKYEEALRENIRTSVFVGNVLNLGNKPVNSNFKTKEELEQRIQSDFDRVNTYLTLIPKIKKAIAEKNLVTTVTFCGKTYTITEVLALRQTVELRKTYLSHLRNQAKASELEIQRSRSVIDSQVAASSSEDKANLALSFEALQGLTQVTPHNKSLASLIEDVSNEITYMETELDLLLSETNLATTIELDGII